MHPLGARQRVHRRHQAAGEAGIHARDHKGRERVGTAVDAGVVEPGLVGLDRPQHQPEGRAEDPERQVEGQDRDDRGEVVAVVEGELPVADPRGPEVLAHDDAEEMRAAGLVGAEQHLRIVRIDLQAGLAVGDRGEHRIGEVVGHLREGEGEDREVDPRPAQRDVADAEREQARDDHRERQAPDHVVVEQLVHPDHGVGADPEKGGVAEGEVAGEAEQDVEPDREDAEDRDPLHEVRVAGVEGREAGALGEGLQDDRREHGEQDHDDQEAGVFRRQAEQFHGGQSSITPARPIRPRGRVSRMMIATR